MVETILVAERDEPTIEVLIRALRTGGFEPFVTDEAQTALASVHRERARVAIVGEGLGSTESARLSRALRARFPDLRILVLAPPGSLRPFATADFEPIESDEILARPLDPDRILARIRAHLDSLTRGEGLSVSPRAERGELDPGLVETAARAAALEALEEAQARHDREWARVRAEESQREQGRRVSPPRAPSGPRLPQPQLTGRLGEVSDRLQLLLWLARRKVTGRLQAAGLLVEFVLGDLKTPGVTLERLLAADDAAWTFEESSEAGERSKTAIGPELIGALVRLGRDSLSARLGDDRARQLVPAVELGTEAARVLAYFDGRRSAAQVAELAGVSVTYAGAAALVARAAGLVSVTAGHGASDSPERQASLLRALERMKKLIDDGDHFAVLGVGPSARAEDVEAAYRETVDALELDRPHEGAEAEALRAAVRAGLEEARATLAVPALRRSLGGRS